MKKWCLLCIWFIVILFSGCHSEEGEPILHQDFSGVYTAQVIEVPENYGVSDPPRYQDGQFIVDLYYTDGGQSYYVDLNRKLMTFDPDLASISVTDLSDMAGRKSWMAGDVRFTLETDFLLSMVKGESTVATLDLAKIFQVDPQKGIDTHGMRVEDAFAVRQIVRGTSDLYYILTTEGLCAVTETGAIRYTNRDLIEPTDIMMTEYGLLYLGGSGKKQLWRMNEQSGVPEEEITVPSYITDVPGIGGSSQPVSFYSGDDTYDFFAATEYALWGITISAEAETLVCTPRACVNWLNSDIVPASLSALCVADHTTIAAIERGTEGNRLLILTAISESEILSRTVITLANLSEDNMMNQMLQRAIREFHRANEDYRIILTDFTIYDPEVRSTIFAAEITAGHIPDIVMLSSAPGADSAVRTYTDRGFFCDLLPLMQESDTFAYEDLLGYVTKPYTEEGKQYVFPLLPSCTTQFGQTAYVQGPMTVEETFAAIEALGEEAYWVRHPGPFKWQTLLSTLGDYTDVAEGTCSFDSPAYTELLAKLKSLSEDRVLLVESSLHRDYYPLVREGKLRLLEDNPRSLYTFASLSQYFGETAVAVGYPNAERALHVRMETDVFFAICDGSAHKPVAFSFLESILTAFADGNYNSGNYAFFEQDVYRQLESCSEKVYVLEDTGRIGIYTPEKVPAGAKKTFTITEEDAQAYIQFLHSIDAVLPEDSPLYDIVVEEYTVSDTRPPEQIAQSIQSRAAIYMAEQYQ